MEIKTVCPNCKQNHVFIIKDEKQFAFMQLAREMLIRSGLSPAQANNEMRRIFPSQFIVSSFWRDEAFQFADGLANNELVHIAEISA